MSVEKNRILGKLGRGPMSETQIFNSAMCDRQYRRKALDQLLDEGKVRRRDKWIDLI